MDQMWPRGFPLEFIKDHNNGANRQILCQKMRRSSVQQGLVHHDPDVDAIYRLIHADTKTGLDVGFNKYAPSILLAPGTYSPWNSQNTLFHKSAFHILMLPMSVSFRTTDIWRSFFAQKILHLSGLTVSFTPVNAVQFRNSHDFLKDFRDESQVYSDSGKILQFLDAWNCSYQKIEDCMKELAKDFVKNEFWGEDDEKLIDLYIQDLIQVNFKFPGIRENQDSYEASENETEFNVNCRRANFEFSLTQKKSQEKLNNFGDISDWCEESNFTKLADFPSAQDLSQAHQNDYVLQKHQQNVLLIVNNWPWKFGIGHLQRLYQPYFASVVFCGSYYPEEYQNSSQQGFGETQNPFNFIHINPTEIYRGFLGYHCLTLLHEVGLQNIEGYIFMADDAHFNIWQRIDFTRVFHVVGMDVPTSKGWWTNPVYGTPAAKRIISEIQNTTDTEKLEAWKKFETGLRTFGYISPNQTAADDLLSGKGRSVSDFFYIPKSEIDYYSTIMRIFFENKLFLELAVNRFIRSVRHQTSNLRATSYLWGNRGKWPEVYNVNMVAMHPLKLSAFKFPNENRRKYCEKILKPWHEILFKKSGNYTVKMDDEPDYMNG
ncbi:unnamed protein product [Caenorhabditis angaria]|uniref:Uncharacterized protein n=1 Tax=Caenorhabditis angaria TaxID=860376 RepID=A0A9P1I9P6_9PELO|nr:unnamed protein product [Caenorhabditis angaria]